jgi:predicted metalloprotease with PDZ domain
MYGEESRKPGTFAANCLLTRRLLEQGVRFVQLFHRGWDQHGGLPTNIPKQCQDIDQPQAALIQDLASAPERPDFARVERSQQQESGSRETLRAYIGSIPDYATEVKGVKLSGVRAGSPAEKGGLQGGDVIVEFGGQKITNIYDYTFALDAVKIGQTVDVSVERGKEAVRLKVVPEARK